MTEVYSPEEDSYLMSNTIKREIPKVLKKHSDITFFEIGSGSGINLKTALESGIKIKNIFSCDINPKAVKHCKSLGFNCKISDLFNKIPKKKFDFIIFNPPYLPEDESEPKESKLSTTGGKYGSELSIKFLKQAKNYLNDSGRIFLITSSLSNKINFSKLGYKSKLLGKKKLFFEELFIWEVYL
jgi:HemK-related putative methylase